MKAPQIDLFVEYSQNNPLVKDSACVEKLNNIFDDICALEVQGDDECRMIWIEAERGTINDFGSYDDYHTEEIVETKEEFYDLWHYYYPEKTNWYAFAVSQYRDEKFFFFDSKLIFQVSAENNANRMPANDLEFLSWLQGAVKIIITKRIMVDQDNYNDYIIKNLPYQKRYGKIKRKDYWKIFPDEKILFEKNLPGQTIGILEKVVEQSLCDQSQLEIKKITADDFFRYCEIGYDANGYFDNRPESLSPVKKYIAMADRRDCGLTKIDGSSEKVFRQWHENESRCGGHPWEICRGGNSTHISLYVHKRNNGWLLRLAGSSTVRVMETVKIAAALYSANVPFYLEQANEILRMVKGLDYIGIVPETILPAYCHGRFPSEEKIIDFMNLGTEKKEEIIKKATWYPEKEIKIKEI